MFFIIQRDYSRKKELNKIKLLLMKQKKCKLRFVNGLQFASNIINSIYDNIV